MASLEALFPDQVHTIPTPVALACFILCGTVPLTSGISLALHGITRRVDPNELRKLTLSQFTDLCTQFGKRPDFLLTRED